MRRGLDLILIKSALNAFEKFRTAEVGDERPLYRPKTLRATEREKEGKEKRRTGTRKEGISLYCLYWQHLDPS